MRGFFRVSFCILIIALAPATVSASLIPITYLPDLGTWYVDAVYQAGALDEETGVLTATGGADAISYHEGADFSSIYFGAFSLIANIRHIGDLQAGSFEIYGCLVDSCDEHNVPLLLNGQLTGLYYEPYEPEATSALYFTFSDPGGDIASHYRGAGLIILSNTTFHGNFGEDFYGGWETGAAADTWSTVDAIPEPQSFLTLGAGAALLWWFRRRQASPRNCI